jgi:Na+-driven multidrug efflux pump
MDNLKIRDASGWTMFIFGVLALLLGFIGLLRPEFLLSLLGFTPLDRAARASGDFTIVFMTASSMASFNMGVYYILAALTDFKNFYLWTVPFRTMTFIVFSTLVITKVAPLGFFGIGAWEGFGALVTAVTLYKEKNQRSARPAKKG